MLSGFRFGKAFADWWDGDDRTPSKEITESVYGFRRQLGKWKVRIPLGPLGNPNLEGGTTSITIAPLEVAVLFAIAIPSLLITAALIIPASIVILICSAFSRELQAIVTSLGFSLIASIVLLLLLPLVFLGWLTSGDWWLPAPRPPPVLKPMRI